MTIPTEVAAELKDLRVVAESVHAVRSCAIIAALDRIQSALASSAEPVADDAKDAARFRWLRDHAINTEGRKGSPWCVYGLDLGDCTPAFGAELVAMVDDAMANGIACSPVPVESLGRDAEPPASVPDGPKPVCTWPDCRNVCAWPADGKPSCATSQEGAVP